MTFRGQLAEIARNTGIRFDQVVRKVVIDLTSDLVKLTPVDTGHARSNWYFGMDRVVNIDPSENKAGGPTFTRLMAFTKDLKAGGTFYITNNVPYIMELEYGSSKQAPSGMARIVVARWQQIVDGAVKAGSQDSRMTSFRAD